MKNSKYFKNSIVNCISKNYSLRNKGYTLVEMIVTFLLLAIFLTCTSTLISYITSMYYHVKGETYSKQVSDIIMEKAVAEISGAKYKDGDSYNNPKLDNEKDKLYGSSISMYDNTDTRVSLYVDYDDNGKNGELCVHYAEIQDNDDEKNREATTWKFDREVYKGFFISDFQMVRGDGLAGTTGTSLLEEYDITLDASKYDKSVMVIFMTIDSDKYGEYKTVRFVNMYNVQ